MLFALLMAAAELLTAPVIALDSQPKLNKVLAPGPVFQVFIGGQSNKPVIAGDTAYSELILISTRDSTIVVDSIITGIGQSNTGAQLYYQWRGDTTDRVVAARDTLRIPFVTYASKPGEYGMHIDVYSNAGLLPISSGVTVNPAVPF
jgi:hypothetical protein